MKIKPNYECEETRYGAAPACFVSGRDATIPAIYDEFFRDPSYEGEIFAALIDCSSDEYQIQHETPIYYLHDLIEVVIELIGPKYAFEWIEKRYGVKIERR